MTFRLKPAQMVAATQRSHWYFLGGVTLFVCGIFTGGYICMTGLLGVMVGASLAGFGSPLLPRGMWFLGAVLWLLSLFIYAGLSYLHLSVILVHRGGVPDFAALALATWLVGFQSRFLLTATSLNWRASQR